MYRLLGWLNIFMTIVIIMPFILRKIDRLFLKNKSISYLNIIKFLRRLHKPFGIILFISAIFHGILALGVWRIHTGMILGIVVAVTALLGISFYIIKKKWIFIWHKTSALVLFVLLLIHLIFPSILNNLFGI